MSNGSWDKVRHRCEGVHHTLFPYLIGVTWFTAGRGNASAGTPKAYAGNCAVCPSRRGRLDCGKSRRSIRDHAEAVEARRPQRPAGSHSERETSRSGSANLVEPQRRRDRGGEDDRNAGTAIRLAEHQPSRSPPARDTRRLVPDARAPARTDQARAAGLPGWAASEASSPGHD